MRRLNFLFSAFLLFALLIVYRLFYWQIKAGEKLAIIAESQRTSQIELLAQRGRIFAADHSPLVENQEIYLVYADLTKIPRKSAEIIAQIASVLKVEKSKIKKKLNSSGLAWVILKHRVKKETKKKIESLAIPGIGFERESMRFYPEASLSAQLLGFVGSDENGRDKGYFGLEGYYNLELKGRPGTLYQEKDVSGKPILVGRFEKEMPVDGRDLVLHLDRVIQYMVEKELKEGIKIYGAKSGSVVIMDPQTGAVLAMASFPSYDPGDFKKYDKSLYKNPVVAESFEPGSIFKVITMAAALSEGAVTPETRCDKCDGPRKIGDNVIHTYDNKYYPNSTMKEVLEHSDNVGMVFATEKLGKEKLLKYIKNFGFGKLTGIDLEEEATPKLRPDKKWRKIDLAAAAFGQGIAVTAIQMVRATGAIANGGMLLEPHVVAKVIGKGREMKINPKIIRRVITREAAKDLTEMMVAAVDHGFPHWKKYGISNFRIAGKTGTAQIPLAGHYDNKKTIASFVGFAPADRPKFVMLVTLREPSSSPWGANTAAPLWFRIAKKLFLYYGISPGK